MTTNKPNRPNLAEQANHWHPERLCQRLSLSALEKQALLEKGSLTAKFKQQCPSLKVQVLSEDWQRPLQYEQEALQLAPHQKAWVRTVLLTCQGKPLLYARTLIPNMQPGNPWFALKKLGTQPLGEVLFSLKQAKRSTFQLHKSPVNWPFLADTLSQETTSHQQVSKLITLPARYSTFTQKGSPLLLTEAFFL